MCVVLFGILRIIPKPVIVVNPRDGINEIQVADSYLVVCGDSIVSGDICLVWFYSKSGLSSSHSR